MAHGSECRTTATGTEINSYSTAGERRWSYEYTEHKRDESSFNQASSLDRYTRQEVEMGAASARSNTKIFISSRS